MTSLSTHRASAHDMAMIRNLAISLIRLTGTTHIKRTSNGSQQTA